MPKFKSDEITNDRVSIREVYNLIDSRFTQVSISIDTKVGQVAASVDRLEGKFDTLEAGRLSAVEKEVANVQGRMMLIPILISSAVSVFGVVVSLVLKK